MLFSALCLCLIFSCHEMFDCSVPDVFCCFLGGEGESVSEYDVVFGLSRVRAVSGSETVSFKGLYSPVANLLDELPEPVSYSLSLLLLLLLGTFFVFCDFFGKLGGFFETVF